jgi:4-hydroxythreonine-4-phosphate dehydrogenase
MREVGFTFPGQTEFFAHRTKTADYTMCLTGGPLTVALVTAHIPYRAVPKMLTPRGILRTGLQLADFLALRLGATLERRVPRIAVAGLNPHAGEEGLLGGEEGELITPCIERLNAAGGAVFSGPCSPDTVFYRAAQGEFDGVVCMYHDQGLIPLKLLAFHEGVNVTLGLPFPRTSPDHGTAFEMAGRGVANSGSMLAALNLAAELALRGQSQRS